MKRILVLPLLFFIFYSCSFRELDYNYFKSTKVAIVVNWEGVADKPELVKALFYPEQGGDVIEHLIEPEGEIITLPVGNYNVIIHSWDTRRIKFANISSYEIYNAYTEESVSFYLFSKSDDLSIKLAPDKLYTSSQELFTVTRSSTKSLTRDDEIINTITVSPQSLVVTHRIFVPVVGLKNIKSVNAVLSGLKTDVLLYNGKTSNEDSNVLLESEQGEREGIKGLWFTCRSFGVSETAQHKIDLVITRQGNTNQIFSIDISNDLKQGNNEVLVASIEINPDMEGENGFEPPKVDDWENEDVDVSLN